VKDCFHRLKIPGWLSRYFALPAVPAKDLGMTGWSWFGRRLGAMSPVIVGWAVLPMGFSWSLFFAPAGNADKAAREVGVAASAGLSDRGPTLVIRPAAGAALEHYTYVDNLGAFCSDRAFTEKLVARWVRSFESCRLLLHHSEARTGVVEMLGTEVDWNARDGSYP
jgi:hypothetical protein